MNSVEPGQFRMNISLDLELNCLTLMVFLKEFLKKFMLKKNSRQQKEHAK